MHLKPLLIQQKSILFATFTLKSWFSAIDVLRTCRKAQLPDQQCYIEETGTCIYISSEVHK